MWRNKCVMVSHADMSHSETVKLEMVTSCMGVWTDELIIPLECKGN